MVDIMMREIAFCINLHKHCIPVKASLKNLRHSWNVLHLSLEMDVSGDNSITRKELMNGMFLVKMVIILNPKHCFWIQCDGVSLDLASGPSLEGIAVMNIPSIYGGSNLWGDTPSKKKQRKLEKKLQRNRERDGDSHSTVGLTQSNIDLMFARQCKWESIFRYCIVLQATSKALAAFMV